MADRRNDQPPDPADRAGKDDHDARDESEAAVGLLVAPAGCAGDGGGQERSHPATTLSSLPEP